MVVQNAGQAPSSANDTSHNLLKVFPGSIRDLLAKRGEHILVASPRVLTQARTVPRFAHFLLSGASSLVTVLQDGRGIQSCLLGPGCVAEAYHLLGAAQVFTEVVMEIEGIALRVPFGELEALFHKADDARHFILAQIQNNGLVANQLVACTYFHELEPRLASLLLLLSEHALSPTFHLTQEFLATMLGVRRTTLTLAAGKLQRQGVIHYSRGQIQIRDREQLAQMACECYSVIRTINTYCRLPQPSVLSGSRE